MQIASLGQGAFSGADTTMVHFCSFFALAAASRHAVTASLFLDQMVGRHDALPPFRTVKHYQVRAGIPRSLIHDHAATYGATA